MIPKSVGLSLMLALFLGALGLGAQDRVALVIGNGAYSNISPLRNPPNDAQDIARVFEGLGFTVTTVLDGSLAQMEDGIRTFRRSLRPGGMGVFFYAGHGVQSEGINYLIPVDANVQDEYELRYKAVNVNLLLDAMNVSGSAYNLVLLDACRDNPFASFRSAATRGLSVVSAPRGSTVVYATGAGQVAADGSGRNSPFTQALLTHLPAGEDIQKTLNRVGMSVIQSTNGVQVPAIYSNFFGELSLSGVNAAQSRARELVQGPSSPAAQPVPAQPVPAQPRPVTPAPSQPTSVAATPAAPSVPATPAPQAGGRTSRGTPVLGRSLSGTLNRASQVSGDGRPVDWYSLPVRTGQRLSIALDSSWDNYLYLFTDLEGERSFDDSDTSNARADYRATADTTLWIGASAYSTSQEGSYTLTITQGASAQPLTLGRPASGRLDSRTPLVNGYRAVLYSLSGRPGDRVNISLDSPDFDAYLEVTGGQGLRLTDDDSGTDMNSFLSVTFPDATPLEIVARGLSSTSEGAFTLRADPARPAAPLTVGRTINGRLDSSDPKHGDSYNDEYAFTGQAGRVYRISARSSELDPVVQLTSARRSERVDDTEGTDAVFETWFEQQETVILSVTNATGERVGAYTLLVEERPANPPVRIPGPGQSLGVNQSWRAYLSRDGVHNYRIEVPSRAQGFVTLTTGPLSPSTFEALNEATGESFSDVQYQEGGQRILELGPGRYAVNIAAGSSSGLYTLGLTTGAERRELENLTGSLNNEAWFDLTLVAGTRTLVELTSDDFDAYLEVFDNRNTQVAYDDDSGPGNGSRVDLKDLAAGAYRVKVRGYSEGSSGNFRLRLLAEGSGRPTLRAAAAAPAAPTGGSMKQQTTGGAVSSGPVGSLEPGQTVSGRIDSRSPTDRDGNRHQAYRVVVRPNTRAILEASSDYDNYLIAEGPQFLEDDDSGEGLNARLELTQPGTYTVRVRPVSGEGPFTLRFTEGRPLVETQRFTGTLPSSGTQNHPVRLASGRVYVFELNASDFDAYLRLKDSSGRIFGEDDDSGEGLNSRLEVRADRSGGYILEVDRAGTGGGPYTLIVREEQ